MLMMMRFLISDSYQVCHDLVESFKKGLLWDIYQAFYFLLQWAKFPNIIEKQLKFQQNGKIIKLSNDIETL